MPGIDRAVASLAAVRCLKSRLRRGAKVGGQRLGWIITALRHYAKLRQQIVVIAVERLQPGLALAATLEVFCQMFDLVGCDIAEDKCLQRGLAGASLCIAHFLAFSSHFPLFSLAETLLATPIEHIRLLCNTPP